MEQLLIAVASAAVGAVLGWLLGLRGSRRQTRAQERLAQAQDALAKSQAEVAEAHRRLADAEVERAKSDARRAELEVERAKWEALAAFSPVGRIVGNSPDPQAVLVEAGEEFQVTRLDYCNVAEASLISHPVQPPLVGKGVRVPINHGYMEQLYWKTHDERTFRADVRFRVHVTLLGHRRVVLVPARLEKDAASGPVRLIG